MSVWLKTVVESAVEKKQFCVFDNQVLHVAFYIYTHIFRTLSVYIFCINNHIFVMEGIEQVKLTFIYYMFIKLFAMLSRTLSIREGICNP